MINEKETSISQQRIQQRATGETRPQVSRNIAPLKSAGPEGHGPVDSAKERRRTPRYQALKGSLLTFCSPSHEENEGNGDLSDVSKHGCRLTSEVPLTVSQYYRLILHAIGGEPVTIETAVVCWRSKSVYGLKFVTVDEDQEELLEQNLFQLKNLS
jgi:hypothetical protein